MTFTHKEDEDEEEDDDWDELVEMKPEGHFLVVFLTLTLPPTLIYLSISIFSEAFLFLPFDLFCAFSLSDPPSSASPFPSAPPFPPPSIPPFFPPLLFLFS